MKSILKMLALMLTASAVLYIPALAQQPASILGKTDLAGLLESAPTVPTTVESAVVKAYGANATPNSKSQLDSTYDSFNKRAAVAHSALKDAMALRTNSMQQQDPAAFEKQAKAQVNSNPIVAGMGGIDKLQQMTPEERKQAATQSVQKFQQNLVTGNGRNSPEMQAMMQKVMSDPAYRAKLMKMSEAEQREEMRKNMGTVAPPTAEQHEKAQQQLKEGNEVATAMAVRKEIDQMMQHLGQVEIDFMRREQVLSKTPGNHNQIMDDIGAKLAKVPIVELGEYGRDRDPEQVMALERERAKRDRDRAAQELPERAKLYQQRKTQYQDLIAAYQTWLKQNQGRINSSVGQGLQTMTTNSELAVAGYEDQLIGLSENLTKYSQRATTDAAGYEMSYRDKASSSGSATLARAAKPKK